MADSPNTFMLLLRLGMSLGMVLALVGAFTWVLRRRGLLRPSGTGDAAARLQVVDRKSLGKRASIVVASVGEVTVLLGVTDQQVNVLATAPGAGGTWSSTPAAAPTGLPAAAPTGLPAAAPTGLPAGEPTGLPAGEPTGLPAGEPIVLPAAGQQPTHVTQPLRPAPRCNTVPGANAPGPTMGARRTGTRGLAHGADTQPTGMSFVDALRELTVRKS